jgi:hypothetical protein
LLIFWTKLTEFKKTISLILPNLRALRQRLAEAWAELHEEELMADGNLLIAGQSVEPIKP